MSNSSIDAGALGELKNTFLGEVVTPDSPDYDDARKVWNGMIDRRPALVVKPKNSDDVVAAVRFASARGLLVSVRGGGHSMAGVSTNDGGIVIDLRAISEIEADPEARTIKVGGGALLEDVDKAAQAHGMAVPVGVVGHTGVGGLTLGGGLGRLHRMYGLTIDNLLSVELVTADGRQVKASQSENPELFWGIRGAGANFGIVTSFEFRMHPIGTMLNAAMNIFKLEDAPKVLAGFGAFMAQAPDTVMGAAQIAVLTQGPFPPHLMGQAVLMVPALNFGDPDQTEAVLAPVAALGEPLVSAAMQVPYLALQTMTDETFAWGNRYHVKGSYINTPSEELIDVLLERFNSRPSDHCDLALLPMGGAIAKVGEDDTAFSGRKAPFFIGIEAAWTDPEKDAVHQAWVRGTYDAASRFFYGGNYVNAADEEKSMADVYGKAKYERLVALKRVWDPGNLFRLNGNIVP